MDNTTETPAAPVARQAPKGANSAAANVSDTLYRAFSLLSVTVLIFLLWQAWAGFRQYQVLKQQVAARESVIQQSRQLQAALQTLGQGLMELARTDADAAAVVAKFKISMQPAAKPTAP
ncbi:MAG: hypothetical protein WC708_04060 [Lentisphaeria bacterium]